jgi:integrase
MSALSYMQRRRSGIYEFRRRLPSSLAGKPAPRHIREALPELVNPKTGRFKGEVVRSLHTSDHREAKRRDHREALRVQGLFDEAERALAQGAAAGSLSEADIREIADDERARLLATDEAEREEGDERRTLQTRKDREQWEKLSEVTLDPNKRGMEDDHFEAYRRLAVGEHGDEYRQALAKRDPKIVEPETRALLRRRGLSFDPASEAFRLLCMEVLKAHVDAYGAMAARNSGEQVDTPKAAASDRGPKLSEAFELWKAGGGASGTRKPSAPTLLEAEHAVRRFKEMHGDLRLGDIDRTKAREFRDAMAKLPTRLPAKLRTMTLKALLARDLSAYPPRDGATVNKLLAMLGAIVSRSEADGRMDGVAGWTNPFDKRLRLALDTREPGRELFATAELRALFASPVYSHGLRPRGGGGEAAFWFPLVAMLSGMRLEEIAGLRVRDLALDEETGRWVFEVRHYEGRSLKTASSLRRVPVHKELVRLGLVKYRETLVEAGAALDDPLWPDVKAGSAGRPRSALWSKWFGRYLRAAGGVPDRRKAFHSFRHTFKRACRDAGLPEEVHDALTGHAGNGGVGRGYGAGVSLGPLVQAMDRVKSPVELSGL